MTEERAQIAEKLKQSLQQEIDRLGLGLEILFVGLKDVHPPVDVAPAYQAVVSAQEEKGTNNRYRAGVAGAHFAGCPGAGEPDQDRTGCELSGSRRHAQGAAARFSAIIQADRENSAVFRFRLKLDVIEQVLGNANKIILAAPVQAKQELYLDLRDMKNFPPP